MSTTVTTELPKIPPTTIYLPAQALEGSRAQHVVASNWPSVASVLADVLLICASGFLAYSLRFFSSLSTVFAVLERHILWMDARGYLGFLLIYLALVTLIAYSQNLYISPVRSRSTESWLTIRSVAVATLILAAFIYLSGNKRTSRLVVGFTAVFTAATMTSWRLGRIYVIRRKRAKGVGLRHVLIVGAGKIGQLLADQLEREAILGYQVKGFLDANHNGDPRVLGQTKDLARIARQEFIDEVFVTVPSERELVKKVALEARHLNLSVKVVPELYDGLAWLSPVEFVGKFPVRVIHREPIPAFGLFLKRLVDTLVAVIGLLLLSPIFGLVALAIILDSPGPVFYHSQRVGKKGRLFLCHKFRTMVANAEELKKDIEHLNEREGILFKVTNDPRVTRLGRFLRKFSIDEFPQLWNVLTGDMSLVGPRPAIPSEFEKYDLQYFRRLDMTPGLTGLWQVTARNDPSFETYFALDLHYIENWSPLLDLKLVLKTIPVVLSGTGS